MPHVTPGPTLDASDVLVSRRLDFLASKRPTTQEKLCDGRRLDTASETWLRKSEIGFDRLVPLICVPKRIRVVF